MRKQKDITMDAANSTRSALQDNATFGTRVS